MGRSFRIRSCKAGIGSGVEVVERMGFGVRVVWRIDDA
jgi:hypothetical protein